MSATSSMLALGTRAPAFSLPEVGSDKLISLQDFAAARALVVVFPCAHCPYVVHVQAELARLSRDYAAPGVAFVGITSNDILAYPQDAPEPTAAMARAAGWTFPVLFDETQATAIAYSAACTPDTFLFDGQRRLGYRGQLDDSRPGGGECRGGDLRAALDAMLAGQPPSKKQRPSVGCSIKWKRD